MVADRLAYTLLQFGSNTPGDVNSGEASRLRANDPNILLTIQTYLEDVFRHLGRFPAASVTRDNDNPVTVQLPDDLIFVFGDGQHLGRVIDRLRDGVA